MVHMNAGAMPFTTTKYSEELLAFDPRDFAWYDPKILLGERLPRQNEILLRFSDRVPLREQLRLDAIALDYIFHICGWPPERDRVPDETYVPFTDKSALAQLAGNSQVSLTQPIWHREYCIIGRALPVPI